MNHLPNGHIGGGGGGGGGVVLGRYGSWYGVVVGGGGGGGGGGGVGAVGNGAPCKNTFGLKIETKVYFQFYYMCTFMKKIKTKYNYWN